MENSKKQYHPGAQFFSLIEQLYGYLNMYELLGLRGIEQTAVEIAGMSEARPTTLEALREQYEACQRCKLSRERHHLVFGEGNSHADLVFVGEAPGYSEDRQGRPFVGRAGELLTRILAAINLSRKEVYITNVVKCRPPQNRNPAPDEVRMCEPILHQQLQIIQPKLICALGAFAAQTLVRTDTSISRLRGKFYDYHGIKVLSTFHPAYLLRNPGQKRLVWEDMQLLRKTYDALRERSEE